MASRRVPSRLMRMERSSVADLIRYIIRTVQLNQKGDTVVEITSDYRPVLFSQDGRRVLFILAEDIVTTPTVPLTQEEISTIEGQALADATSDDEQALVDEEIREMAAEMKAAEDEAIKADEETEEEE